MKQYNRIVNLNLPSTKLNRDIIDSVIGQLSDGKWENSPAMRKYWAYCQVDVRGGLVVLQVNDEDWSSGFRNRDDAWVRKFFACKIKQVAYDELSGLRWNRTDTSELSYLSQSSKVTVSAAYEAYDAILGRKGGRKQYASSPAFIARQAALVAKDAEILAAERLLERLIAERNSI